MDFRRAELHASALSPPEFKAFSSYLQALTGRASVTASSIKPDTTFVDINLRRIVADRIKVDDAAFERVYEAIQPGSNRDLSVGETFALFRLLSHARVAKARNSPDADKVDLALVFVPSTPFDPTAPVKVPPPVPVRARKTSSTATKSQDAPASKVTAPIPPARATSSRQSLPARFPSNPFQQRTESPDKKDRAKSVAFDDNVKDSDSSATTAPKVPAAPVETFLLSSSNPFRQRQVSGPTIVARPPPVPSRKPSAPPSSSPNTSRRGQRVSSVSSATSLISHNTSGARASPLIQSSLSAAAVQSASVKKVDPSIHVIRNSTDTGSSPARLARRATLQKHAELARRVSDAVKEWEKEETISPPPRRAVSTRSKSKIRTLSKTVMDRDPHTTAWTCVDLIQGIPGDRPYAMIILNQPITRKDIFLRAWAASELRLCADGGANRLYDLFNDEQRSRYMPTLIKGDLDSLRSDVREYYASKGVAIKHDGSEYSTDLQKCIEEVETLESDKGVTYDLLLIGGLSGRVDQTVHVMSLLHKLRKTRPRSYILSSESLAWVIDEGSHVIEIDHSTMGQTCGILPVGIDSAHVKTKGLKWNLDWETSFDGDVSSSNHLLPSEPLVQITTNKPILWCIEIKPNLPMLSNASTSTSSLVRRQRSIGGPSRPKVAEIPQGIKDLSVGLAKAAQGVGRELEKLQSVNVSGSGLSTQLPREAQAEPHDPQDVAEPSPKVRNTDKLREEAGWSRLD